MTPAGTASRNGNARQVVAAIPFTAAAHEHQEPAFTRGPTTLTANQQQLDTIDLPAFGFLRHIYLDVTVTGAVGGTLAADGPFNIIASLTLLDVNGAPIVGPLDGFALQWANIAGGYSGSPDARDQPSFVGSAPNPSFRLRIPIEISHYNGLGSLANQNAAAPYQVMITLNTLANIYSVAPTGTPQVTITATEETWTLPSATDVTGRPQQQLPPAHGTGQKWTSRTANNVGPGDSTVQLNRVGNLIRNLVYIARTSGGVRSDACFPDPVIVNLDGRQLLNEPQKYLINNMYEELELFSATRRDTGVFVLTFANSQKNRAGDDTPNLWLPTVQSTRLELKGTIATGGNIQQVVNDVQPIEVNPAERYVESNVTAPAAIPGPAPSPISG
jgi:hypothetical protein